MAVGTTRRKNLSWLVDVHGSQTDLASEVPGTSLTQPVISLILREKRPLHEHEARVLEGRLGIPANWLDCYSLRESWKLVKQFGKLSEPQRFLVNEMLAFVASRGNASDRIP